MASAWGNSWGNAWGDSWGAIGVAFLVDTWGPRKKRKKIDTLKKEAPIVAKEIKALVEKVIEDGKNQITFEQMKAHFDAINIKYANVYYQVYIELLKEQEQEYEEMAACMAVLIL
tara:strand:- start:21 stop:365 length:345 start_codon:yes stop_codon:yes gene_type:complete